MWSISRSWAPALSRPAPGRRRPLALLLPLPALLAGGCLDYQHFRLEGVDTFVQRPSEQVDVLLVVDNSSSMGPHQEKLGRNFAAFISWFVEGNVDYHIAVTTTDDGNDPSVPDPARGRFVGPLVTSDLPEEEAAALFQEEVNVGIDGTGVEVGLEAAWLALGDPALAEQAAAFMRDEADLSIVFVSDEEDSSPWPVNDYINAFFAIKGQRDRDVFNASALTVTDERACSEDVAANSAPGTRYVDVAGQTGGASGNLCDTDFEGILRDLSLANGRQKDTFRLSHEPDPKSLVVTVTLDGVDDEIPCDAGAWAFVRVPSLEGDLPAVKFARDHLPPPSSRLTVRYFYGTGSVQDFCTSNP